MAYRTCIDADHCLAVTQAIRCMRLANLCVQDDKSAWVQLTVQIPSEQTFAAYNGKRALVAGDPDKPVKVVDTWVFERALKKDPSTRYAWRPMHARILLKGQHCNMSLCIVSTCVNVVDMHHVCMHMYKGTHQH